LFVAFAFTAWLLVETFQPSHLKPPSNRDVWQAIPDRKLLLAVFATSGMLQVSLLTIEPIVTVYVKQLLGPSTHVALTAGLVIAASGFANVMAAPQLGKLCDRIGPRKVLLGSLLAAAVLLVPQALVRDAWQLTGLRFLFGLATAGLVPAVNSLVRGLAPDAIAGRIYGYNQSAQYLGNICGPVMGGLLAARYGIPCVFYVTAVLLLLTWSWVYVRAPRLAR
jgi:DHA1 family multidrug resistance protein-like MFS transporter